MLSKITVLVCCCLTLALSKPAEVSKYGLKALQLDTGVVLPSHCTAERDVLLVVARTTALNQSTNCSVSAFSKVVEKFYIYSAEYVSKALKVVTEIGLHFTGCAAELIPLDVMVCVFHSLLELPAEVDTLVVVSFQYFANILSLVPPLVSDIESCFTNVTANYQQVVKDLVHKAEVCETSFVA